MTRDEIGELVAALPQGLDADEFIHRLVNWAVDLEREACAKVCEETTASWTQHLYNSGCVDCAVAIRARGEK